MEEFAVIKPYISLGEKLGKIYFQVTKEPISNVVINYYGELAKQETALIDLTVLKGILDPILKGEVNYINSKTLAERRGININSHHKNEKYGNYPCALEIIITGEKGARFQIVGHVGSNREERIINIKEHVVDMVVSENMIYLKNKDVPGVIGTVGVLLGEENVNIGTMNVGRKEDSAIMLLTVDEAVSKESIQKLKNNEKIKWAYYLNLK